MRHIPLVLLFSVFIFLSQPLFAQNGNNNRASTPQDTLMVTLSPEQASAYILQLIQQPGLWSAGGQTLRASLQRLLDHYAEPIDTVKDRLGALTLSEDVFSEIQVEEKESIPLKWLNDSTFIILKQPLDREPVTWRREAVPVRPDAQRVMQPDPEEPVIPVPDTELLTLRYDTIQYAVIDTAYLKNKGIVIHYFAEGKIIPAIIPEENGRRYRMLSDSSAIETSSFSTVLAGSEDSPFRHIPGKQMPDSLQLALNTLLQYTTQRDSVLIHISSLSGRPMPMWLTTRQEEMKRFWVKNYANDSITLWIANTDRNALTLVLEENVNVERREKRPTEHIPIATLSPSVSLATLKPLAEIPVFWTYGLASSLTLNQTFFSYWARGGESSLATTFDIRAIAEHTNKVKKSRWNTESRLRYGSISTDGYKNFRTNTDILEFNSQYNTELREKLDFSTSVYFKTQIAKGYKNPKEDVVISRFLNPGSFTVGVGIEYKPIKDTRINFSPLSYRNTFVLDTAGIDQTLHGIEVNRRTRQEMGGQLVLRNRQTLAEGFNVTNNIRLFSGYLEKPQNVDVDWEINLEKQFNWYFMVRLNLHLIYDDDVRFPITNDAGDPILLPDGTKKRAPRTQLKQILGLTMAFKI